MDYDEVEDFLQDDQFVKWVLFDDNHTFWMDYLQNNQHQIELVEKAKKIILEFAEKEDFTQINQKAIWVNIQNQISGIEPEQDQGNKLSNFKWLGAAAAILLFLSFFLGYKLLKTKFSNEYQKLVAKICSKDNIVEKINETNKPIWLKLNDGTTIILSPKSKISYPAFFNDHERVVVLSGDAKFKVFKNPKKPFYVYTGDIITRVLGTVFEIVEQSKDIKVIVESGKVAVSENLDDKNSVVLLPNQKVIFNKPESKFIKSLVETPKLIVPIPKASISLTYEDAPVSKIFAELQKLYGIEIIYDAETLTNCHVTTKLDEELFFDQLNIICKTIGASYKSVDGIIQIESKGCN